MTDMKSVHKKLVKDFGSEIGGPGGEHKELVRVPTGVFAFDLASGGGLPKGRVSILFGAESSGKTTLALKAIAEHQKRWPELQCAYFDIENSLDPVWAKRLGVDMDALYWMRPLYAEQAADAFVECLGAGDAGILVLDSIAALNTSVEMGKSLEDAVVGNRALLMERLSRKVTTRLIEHNRNPSQVHMPTVIYINQVRTKIGVMFGNPETMPGGSAIRFQATMIVRLFAKGVSKAEISKVLPAWKKTTAVIQKWKVPIMATHSEWDMMGVNYGGLLAGQSDDWKVARGYLLDYELMEKSGSEWRVLDRVFPTQAACRQEMLDDPVWADMILEAIYKAATVDASGTVGYVGQDQE